MDDLHRYWAETEDYRRIFEHLRLDQQTAMPDGATADRARQLGLLEKVIRERSSGDGLARLLRAARDGSPGSAVVDDRLLAAAERDLDRERRMPQALVAEWTEVGATAFPAWRRARSDADWATFAPHLRRLVDLNRRVADEYGYRDHRMDALLSLYDDGPVKADIDRWFADLRPLLVELVGRRRTTTPAVVAPLPKGDVAGFVRALGDLLGFDWNRGTVAISPHPFTSPSGPCDVRVTVRDDVEFADLVQAAVHELGHALYEQGIAPELWGTPAGRGIMPYVHESQSKFYENIVGRREEFAALIARMARAHFSDPTPDMTEQALLQAFVHSPTSLIRIATDEVSFNLHIILRWEIEVALLDGDLDVADVPHVWNERCVEFFGSRPRNDAEGCLQDPHWVSRYFGLFTSYVIGNLVSAQLAECAAGQGVSVQAACDSGDFTGVLSWLRSHVHGPGRLLPLPDLVVQATGSALSTDAYRDHLIARYR